MLDEVWIDTSDDESNPRHASNRFKEYYQRPPSKILNQVYRAHSTDDSTDSQVCRAHGASNAIIVHDYVDDHSTSMGDTSTEFYMEPSISIEDEDDVNPPRIVPPQETTNEWLARIDEEWEVKRLQMKNDFVPTYKPVSATWLTLGPIMLVSDATNNGEGSNASTKHVDEEEALPDRTIELIRPELDYCPPFHSFEFDKFFSCVCVVSIIFLVVFVYRSPCQPWDPNIPTPCTWITYRIVKMMMISHTKPCQITHTFRLPRYTIVGKA